VTEKVIILEWDCGTKLRAQKKGELFAQTMRDGLYLKVQKYGRSGLTKNISIFRTSENSVKDALKYRFLTD
jgi:hypothetical protein